jgi:hypothetical protein
MANIGKYREIAKVGENNGYYGCSTNFLFAATPLQTPQRGEAPGGQKGNF